MAKQRKLTLAGVKKDLDMYIRLHEEAKDAIHQWNGDVVRLKSEVGKLKDRVYENETQAQEIKQLRAYVAEEFDQNMKIKEKIEEEIKKRNGNVVSLESEVGKLKDRVSDNEKQAQG